jgi:hypothetical protein
MLFMLSVYMHIDGPRYQMTIPVLRGDLTEVGLDDVGSLRAKGAGVCASTKVLLALADEQG